MNVLLCRTVIQYIAALSLQIAPKAQNVYKFFENKIQGENIFMVTEARFLPNAPRNKPSDAWKCRLYHIPP
jgi:hypothetical protein